MKGDISINVDLVPVVDNAALDKAVKTVNSATIKTSTQVKQALSGAYGKQRDMTSMLAKWEELSRVRGISSSAKNAGLEHVISHLEKTKKGTYESLAIANYLESYVTGVAGKSKGVREKIGLTALASRAGQMASDIRASMALGSEGAKVLTPEGRASERLRQDFANKYEYLKDLISDLSEYETKDQWAGVNKINRRRKLNTIDRALNKATAAAIRVQDPALLKEYRAERKEIQAVLKKFTDWNEELDPKTLRQRFNDFVGGKGVMHLAAATAGITMGGRLAQSTTKFLTDFTGNRDTAYTELRHRTAGFEEKAGLYGGGAVGALLGSLAGPIGTAIGSAIGSAIGGWLGGTEKRIQTAQESTQEDVLERNRYKTLYGGNWFATRMAEATGYVGRGDIQAMQAFGNTLPTAMAFGGVSDDQYLALSMLPNYWNAIMSGADERTKLEAYRKDALALGPGMAQYFGQKVGINENVRAFATGNGLDMARSYMGGYSEFSERMLDRVAGEAGTDYFNRRRGDVDSRYNTWRYAYKDLGALGYYGYMGNEMAKIATGKSLTEEETNTATEKRKNLSVPEFVKRDLLIQVGDSGEKKKIGEVYTTAEQESYISQQSYIGG